MLQPDVSRISSIYRSLAIFAPVIHGVPSPVQNPREILCGITISLLHNFHGQCTLSFTLSPFAGSKSFRGVPAVDSQHIDSTASTRDARGKTEERIRHVTIVTAETRVHAGRAIG